ncbi:hypothetical protein TeGR_g3808, partial [Tetraparma gracilis]
GSPPPTLHPSPAQDVGIACYLSFPGAPPTVIAFSLASCDKQTTQTGADFVATLPPAACGTIVGGGTGVLHDGGVRLFTSGGMCVAVNAKFEKEVDLGVGGDGGGMADGEGEVSVDAVEGIVEGAFVKYETMLAQSENNASFSSESIVRSVAALGSLAASAVDAGVSLASTALLAAPSSLQQTASDALSSKLARHTSFISFLRHSGLFPRLTNARRVLAEHGEMLNSAIELCNLRNDTVQAGEKDAARALTEALADINNDVLNLVSRLATLQARASASASDSSTDSATASSILRSSSTALVVCFGAALKRRGELLEVYEMGSEAGIWTESDAVRELLLVQLTKIGSLGDSYETKVEDAMLTHNLCVFLLASFKARSLNVDQLEQYEKSKAVCCSLLTTMVKDGSKTALKVAVEHGYSEGICAICMHEDNAAAWGVQELGGMVEEKFGTGAEGEVFCRFVLEWLGKNDLLSDALSIGRMCPPVLSAYLETGAAGDVKWINDARNGDFGGSAASLLDLSGRTSNLLQKKAYLSLAVIAGEADGGASWADDERAKQELVGVYAQEMISGEGGGGITRDTMAMDDKEIAEAAIAELGDTTNGINVTSFAMVVLAVATKIKKEKKAYILTEKNEDLAEALAVQMWEGVMKRELVAWRKIAAEKSEITEQELQERIRGTELWAVMRAYVESDEEGQFGLCGGGGEAETKRLEGVVGGLGGGGGKGVRGLVEVVGIAAAMAERGEGGEEGEDEMDVQQQ